MGSGDEQWAGGKGGGDKAGRAAYNEGEVGGGHATQHNSSSSPSQLSQLHDLLLRVFAVLGVRVEGNMRLAPLFDMSHLSESMVALQERCFVLGPQDRVLHREDLQASRGMM